MRTRGFGTGPSLGGRPHAEFVFISESVSPFIKDFLGLKIVGAEPGHLRFEMELKPSFVGNPFSAVLHGGVAAAALDHAAGFSAWSSLVAVDEVVSTVDLRVDYLKPIQLSYERLLVVGKVFPSSRSSRLIRADAEILTIDGEVLATARGCFNAYKLKKTND